jgi:hypothetical protein
MIGPTPVLLRCTMRTVLALASLFDCVVFVLIDWPTFTGFQDDSRDRRSAHIACLDDADQEKRA